MKFIKLLIAFIVLPFLVGCSENLEPNQITSDGNFLFYNQPPAVMVDENLFVGYLKSDGKVIVQKRPANSKPINILVHDFKKDINESIGKADDHAAPALFYDKNNKVVYVAVAYHGTTMYVYELDIKNNVKLVSQWDGQFSYPRFVGVKRGVGLVARIQNDGRKDGDLIISYLNDNFTSRYTVVRSQNNTVNYTGGVVAKGDSIYFAYSTHLYDENRLDDFILAQFNTNKNELIKTCDLNSHLKEGYFSNRPTGIDIKGDVVTLSTSYFLHKVDSGSNSDANFKFRNNILILEGDIKECSSFKQLATYEDIYAPYYHTSVAIHDSNYLFFNKNAAISNFDIPDCLNKNKMMYPFMLDNRTILYANMNAPYQIRDFNNSIYICNMEQYK